MRNDRRKQVLHVLSDEACEYNEQETPYATENEIKVLKEWYFGLKATRAYTLYQEEKTIIF